MENSLIKSISNRKTVENKKAIRSVQAILRAQFPGLDEKYIDNLPMIIYGGTKMGFQYRLFVYTGRNCEVDGFMIYSIFPRYNFFFLDHMAAAPDKTGRGIGASLYNFLRSEAKKHDGLGIFFECINDDPETAKNDAEAESNRNRLKFYEQFGARPIANNLFHLKVNDRGNSTLLVFDPLDIPITLTRDMVRKIARKIILKKYSDFCPPDYIKKVVLSFKDNPVKMREPRYVIRPQDPGPVSALTETPAMGLAGIPS